MAGTWLEQDFFQVASLSMLSWAHAQWTLTTNGSGDSQASKPWCPVTFVLPTMGYTADPPLCSFCMALRERSCS